MRMTKILLPALLIPVLAACGTAEAGDASRVQSAAVERGDLIVTASATGVLEPIRKVEVTSKASGEILRLYVDIGDQVEPGALLAEVDPRDVRNAADQANADIEVARARIDIARRQVERSQELLESGVISPQEHESRTLEFANARASLVKSRTNSQLAQLRLEDVTIRAPMAGTILEKNVEEGQVIQSSSQNVSSGTTLMVMADLDMIQVRTLVNEGDLGEIMEGMTTYVTVDAYPDQTFVGIVDQIEPQAVVRQSVTLFPLIIRLDNRSRLLKPGMNTAVGIQTGEATGVLLIPNSSVIMPQDAEPAALTLGLDADAVDMENMLATGGMGEHVRRWWARWRFRGPTRGCPSRGCPTRGWSSRRRAKNCKRRPGSEADTRSEGGRIPKGSGRAGRACDGSGTGAAGCGVRGRGGRNHRTTHGDDRLDRLGPHRGRERFG